MKRMALSAGIVACMAAAAFPTLAKDALYGNARFGYTVSYPSELFKAQPESANGDGRVFKSRDGSAEFLVWGSFSANDYSAAQVAAMAEAKCARKPASYRVVKPALVAISCLTADGNIHYEKHLIHGDVETGFEMTYPAAQKAKWDAVLTRISGSLHPGRPAQ